MPSNIQNSYQIIISLRGMAHVDVLYSYEKFILKSLYLRTFLGRDFSHPPKARQNTSAFLYLLMLLELYHLYGIYLAIFTNFFHSGVKRWKYSEKNIPFLTSFHILFV